MLETLMRPGGYRVDYLNDGNHPSAFAFYVWGDAPTLGHSSRMARRHLYAGLEVICDALGLENLAAVYLDVGSGRSAYAQMMADLRAGLFRRVFVFSVYDLITAQSGCEDLKKLYQEVDGFELIVLEKNTRRPEVLSLYDCERYFGSERTLLCLTQ